MLHFFPLPSRSELRRQDCPLLGRFCDLRRPCSYSAGSDASIALLASDIDELSQDTLKTSKHFPISVLPALNTTFDVFDINMLLLEITAFVASNDEVPCLIYPKSWEKLLILVSQRARITRGDFSTRLPSQNLPHRPHRSRNQILHQSKQNLLKKFSQSATEASPTKYGDNCSSIKPLPTPRPPSSPPSPNSRNQSKTQMRT